VDRRINSKAEGLGGVREDDHLLHFRWHVQESGLDAKLNSDELGVKSRGTPKRRDLLVSPVTIP
jgi:hypothetical protein